MNDQTRAYLCRTFGVCGTVSFELSDLSQTWQTVSQSAVWVAVCHQHTAPSARSLFNKDRLCFESLPLSRFLSCARSLTSSPFLCSTQRRTCDAKIRMRCWKAQRRKNDWFVLSLGAVQICYLKSLFLADHCSEIRTSAKAQITPAHVVPWGRLRRIDVWL